MVKHGEVRRCLDQNGFESLRESLNDMSYRFKTTAVHNKHNVRVVISAPQCFRRHKSGFGKPINKRTIHVELMDGACRTIPGVQPVTIVNRLCEIEKILNSIARGNYSCKAA